MLSSRNSVSSRVGEISEPILGEMGLELVDVDYTRRGRDHILSLYVDRPGGVTMDELQRASQELGKLLEIEEVISGRYRLEVSSPGIGRRWKHFRDFERNIGARVTLKTFTPCADGRRQFLGKLVGVEGENILLEVDGGTRVTISYSVISSAKPEVDWERLLKGSDHPSADRPPVRRTP